MSKKPYPSEQADRFIVRLPDGMRDRIAEEARLNGRSMNSEIVARLSESLEPRPDDIPPGVRAVLEHQAKATGTTLAQELERWLAKMLSPPKPPTTPIPVGVVDVILDTDGHPISWHEIHTHVGALVKDSGIEPIQVSTRVITPDVLSSQERLGEDYELMQWYAEQRGKRLEELAGPSTGEAPKARMTKIMQRRNPVDEAGPVVRRPPRKIHPPTKKPQE